MSTAALLFEARTFQIITKSAKIELNRAKRHCHMSQVKEIKRNLYNPRLKWKAVDNRDIENMFPTALNGRGRLVTLQAKLAETIAKTFNKKLNKIRK